LAAPPLKLSADGTSFDLSRPGALLAGPLQAPARDATLWPGIDERPRVVVLDASTIGDPPPDASLYVVTPGALPPGDDLNRILATLRRRIAPGLLAGPAAGPGPFLSSPVDIVVVRPAPDPTTSAWSALAAGVRAAGKPVLVLVDRPVEGDCVVAALDAGAAGAVFACEDDAQSSRLLVEVADRERRRLEHAPLITVAICNRNGARDLEGCLDSLTRVEYPNFETLLVDDGSTDDSIDVGRRFGVRIVAQEPAGLGTARNTAIANAGGEILAYLDGDAQAEPAWLTRMWRLYDRLRPGGMGGPNLGMTDADWQERAVGGAPGVAMPIVSADGRCTHLAGCNMSFRMDIARKGRFDAESVAVGDDVRFCYWVLDLGEDLLLHPTAIVRHHRRRTLKGYLRQMDTYGHVSTHIQADHGERLVEIDVAPSLRRRLDPRRPHYCFVGPQATQRYSLAFAPLSNGFPLKVLALTATIATLGTPPAWRQGRLGAWAALAGASALGQVGYVIARAPVQDGPSGLAGLVNRVLTAGLWYAGPAAVAKGRLRALRENRAQSNAKRRRLAP
jgi:glycosyltransferase involved in cell wall biosynthesis